MYSSFYIDKNRLNELKSFIRDELPTTRFKHNPLLIGSQYNIALDLSVEDGNKLSQLQHEWHIEDNPSKTTNKTNRGFLKKLLTFYNKTFINFV